MTASGGNRHRAKTLVPLLKKSSSGSFRQFPGKFQPTIVESLNGMPERRTVTLCEDIGSYSDDIVRPHPNEESVEGDMVQPAKRQSVPDFGNALWLGVGNDVRGIQKLIMTETA